MTNQATTLQIGIEHSLEQTYLFLADPESFPKWASGLASGLTRADGKWIAESPQGPVEVAFSEANPFGVLDHWVKLPSGRELYVPLRVVANGAGCEVSLTLFRLEGVSEADFARDQEWVRRDLLTLKSLLENGA